MFGSKKKKQRLNDLMEQLRPDLSRESLGVGPDFPGIAPNPLLSGEARTRTAELRTGELALGVLVDWREVNSNPRVVLLLDVETADGISFRGIADEDLTITELTRLAPGQTLPVRYRPAVMDHYVALARDADPAHVQQLADEIARRKRA
ncbi:MULTISPECIES: hypothetical protein [unclassified Microbacterium]|uniref:hypothetical protein n=1 Tax=unclassified Microbacterium TaxID=2609290 RepID=UPI000CFD4CC6|nr:MULTISPECIES: hypothetical protein [unclassified Microbacterium]PQZ53890.1 hypothetical protein CQ032_14550 [Microbacterium sp. MYb43]PQZ76771.1 hypothetical protein CQ031_12480 [Microbacterium sp. MYb40]PRB21042.1 hypothetical protein CQ040_09490 [Microbacterium sp. MYb54]PRB25040.1 hypothetical protein CQ037_15680 [Microbacterium sp. MYb50]PRB66862.1 hypothetical protein CQ021_09180 [Microbacterium sp. MYb24]